MARHVAWKFSVDGGSESFHRTEDGIYRLISAQAGWLAEGSRITVCHRPDKDGQWVVHETLIKHRRRLKSVPDLGAPRDAVSNGDFAEFDAAIRSCRGD